MIHGNNTVEFFLYKRLMEYDVRRERAGSLDPIFLCIPDSRSDHVNLFPSAVPVFTAMWIQCSHTNAGIFNAGTGQCLVGQTDGSFNPHTVIFLQIGTHLRDRDMAGGSGGIKAIRHIDLAKGICMPQQTCQIMMFAFQVQTGLMHTRLVQRSEHIAVNLPLLPQLHAQFQHIQTGFSTFHCFNSKGNNLWIKVFLI